MRETYFNKQSDSREQYTTLWEKNLKEEGSYEEISESSWSYKCNPNQLKAKSEGREDLGWVNKMAAEPMNNWNRLQVNL